MESAVDVISLLVSYGAHIHTDGGKASPLYYAVDSNYSSIISALLSARSNFPDTVSRAQLALEKVLGFAPLHIAVLGDCIDICQLLIDAGADVNVLCRDSSILTGSKETPLQLAVRSGKKDIIRLLLQTPGCQIDNSSPLLDAIYRGLIIIVF